MTEDGVLAPERGLRLKLGKNGIYTTPDPGPEAQREAARRAFPDANVDPDDPGG